MSTFEERGKGFERKFEHDQELAFKVRARRNRLLGLWAAELMGLAAAAAESYAREVVEADLAEPGDGDVIRKVAGDLAAKGHTVTAERVAFELERLATEARRQLVRE